MDWFLYDIGLGRERVNENSNIEGVHFIVTTYSAYANDITFLLRNEKSALDFINTFDTFSVFF